jgi:anti-sigma factor RsiW
MKPCTHKRKLIAWLAVNALDAPAARELHAHLETCAGCRGYLAEISRVREQLAAAAPETELRTTESFHQRVMARVEKESSAFDWEKAVAWVRAFPLQWRAALQVTVVSLMLAAIWIVQSPPTGGQIRLPEPTGLAVTTADAGVDLTPSIANYERAISQSMDKLDALLARQDKPAASSAPVYTAATLSLGF